MQHNCDYVAYFLLTTDALIRYHQKTDECINISLLVVLFFVEYHRFFCKIKQNPCFFIEFMLHFIDTMVYLYANNPHNHNYVDYLTSQKSEFLYLSSMYFTVFNSIDAGCVN